MVAWLRDWITHLPLRKKLSALHSILLTFETVFL